MSLNPTQFKQFANLMIRASQEMPTNSEVAHADHRVIRPEQLAVRPSTPKYEQGTLF